MQKTIKKNILATGMGLHSGRDIQVSLKPGSVDSGVVFHRVDLPLAPAIVATAKNVTSTMLATTLGEGQNTVSTVEHLMAALAALGVDNLVVETNGPELPVFDGSAAEWVRLLSETGMREQNKPRKVLKVTRPYKISAGDKSIEVHPAGRFSVEAHIDFGGTIGRHFFHYVDSDQAFIDEISRSRTFCQLKDVEMMHRQGLALGGSLANAVVVGDDGVLNPEGLRFDDEFVRHKILDFIGDMAMAGQRIMGHFVIRKPGHELNRRFLISALEQPGLLEESGLGDESFKSREVSKSARGLMSRLPLSMDEMLTPAGA